MTNVDSVEAIDPSSSDRGRIRRVGKAAVISFFVVANIFLMLPFALYIGNATEFYAPIGSVLRLTSIPALVLFALLMIGGMLMSERIHRRYIAVLVAVSLLLWLQGYVFLWDYGLLDGGPVDWSVGSWRGWVDLGVWTVFIAVALIWHQKIAKIALPLVTAVYLVQVAGLLFSAYQNSDVIWSDPDRSTSASTLAEISKFSTERNVLHVILDGLQADIFEDIINDEASGPHFRDAFDGFTYYRETIGVFPFTHMSVPALLSGQVYKNHMPKKEFIDDVFKGKTIINSVYKAGYEVDIASGVFVVKMLKKGGHTNAFVIPTSYHFSDKETALNDSLKLLDLSIFRLTPHFFKKNVYNDQQWLVQNIVGNAKYSLYFYFSHNLFLQKIIDQMSVTRTEPVYKFFHLMTTHAPMIVNGDCSFAGGVVPRIRRNVTAQSRCSLDYLVKLLEKMKELGIYDDAVIIVMADHGGHMDPPRFDGQAVGSGGAKMQVSSWFVGMMAPLLMIKEPGAKGHMKVSNAEVSLADLPATISRLLDLDSSFPGNSILDLHLDQERERKFYFYEWKPDDNYSDYNGPIQEFSVTGSIYKAQNWRIGAEFLAPQPQ